MRGFLERTVFRVGSEDYCWGDVVHAARLRGEWAQVEWEARARIACLKRAEEAPDELPDEEDVESVANEFRYERDLISAEEMEAWLERYDLDDEAWMEWIQGSVLMQAWAGELEEVTSRYPATDEELGGFVHREAVCSGRLIRFAITLAGRMAVYQAQQEAGGDQAAHDEEVKRILEPMPAESRSERATQLAHAEAAFRAFRQLCVTPETVEGQIDAHRIDWTRLECLALAFPDEEMAQEAACCIREDGDPLTDVAADAHTDVQEMSFFLDEMEPELRERLLSAQAGELLGPVALRGEFAVLQILDKVLPSHDDPRVRERAERSAVKGAVDREITSRVRWPDRR